MNVLIAGGTGFIGSAIAQELLKEKHTVVILSRKNKKITDCEVRVGDVTRRETLKGVAEKIDIVFQCVQFPNHPVQNPSKGYTYEKYDGEGTENLCEEIKASSVRRIIYISGAGTNPSRSEPWFRAKVRAEKAVKSSGKEYVILRPSLVYGKGDRSMNKFVQFARLLPFVPVIGDGQALVAPIFVEDLARICARAVSVPLHAHEVVEVGGPENLTMNEVQKKVLKIIDKKKPLLHQPLWLMKFAGSVASHILPTPPLSAEAVDFITMSMPVDIQHAENLFKIHPRSLEEGLRSYVK